LTKVKVFQLGISVAVLGLLIFKFTPALGLNDITISSISNLVLITLVLGWVLTYLYRVVNGKMTFMEQRKRYRKEYEKVINEKLMVKFNKMPEDAQNKLMEEIEDK